MNSDKFSKKRREMVETQIISRGINDKRIVDAMLKIPRHNFVPGELVDHAYSDNPLPIGYEQTISQPYIVALMTKVLDLYTGVKILEIGIGSGYQTAVLSEMGCEVYSIEIVEPLFKKSKELLLSLGYENIHFKFGDGYKGWIEHSPFNRIIITAAPSELPKELIAQLNTGGKMITPVGEDEQQLQLIIKNEDDIEIKNISRVKFVPMSSGE